jgi:hypothetical protein
MARRRRCCLGAAHLAAPPPLGKTCHRKKKRLGETVQRRLWRFFPSRILQVGVCCEPDTPPMLAQLAPIANRQSPIAKPAKPAWVRNAPTRGFLAWRERERERERERGRSVAPMATSQTAARSWSVGNSWQVPSNSDRCHGHVRHLSPANAEMGEHVFEKAIRFFEVSDPW